MVKLGAKEEQAKAGGRRRRHRAAGRRRRARASLDGRPAPRCRSTTASTAPGAASAWRSTAPASRSKTATARQGTYFVRYVDPPFAGREEPSFFAKLFTFGARRTTAAWPSTASRSRARATTQHGLGARSQGAPESGEAGKRIVGLLLDDLK